MTLDQLRYFQAVCKYNSVSRASENLNISQPSVSNAISKLEAEFGTMLFTRQNKRLTLTKEGATLLELANDLLLHTDHAMQTMTSSPSGLSVDVGMPTTRSGCRVTSQILCSAQAMVSRESRTSAPPMPLSTTLSPRQCAPTTRLVSLELC